MFGEKTIEEIKEQIGQLLESYRVKVDEAYTKTPKTMAIGFGVKLAPGKTPTSIMVRTTMTFVAERIKDSAFGVADDRQMKIGEAS